MKHEEILRQRDLLDTLLASRLGQYDRIKNMQIMDSIYFKKVFAATSRSFKLKLYVMCVFLNFYRIHKIYYREFLFLVLLKQYL